MVINFSKIKFYFRDFSHNRINKIPEDLFIFTRKLSIIILSGNKLKLIPANLVSGLLKLEDLDLSSNLLEFILPINFQSLYFLQSLKLGDNLLSDIAAGKQIIFFVSVWSKNILFKSHSRFI